ncbi:MAG: exosortase [Kiritimatiellae bacterium]|nr:exosortase [Kiritimatiellia bacterium]
MNFRVRLGVFVLSIASLLWGFQELLLRHAPHAFNAKEEDLTYGWFVPVFSLYVLWTERGRIVKSLGAPSVWGVLLSLPLFALGFVGVRGIQLRFEIVAFAGLLIALPWAFFGRETAKRVIFPAGFLLFCIPLASFLDVVTVHLRLLSTSVAYGTLKGFGVDIVRNGTAIAAADGSFSIDIADPCSGLRSLFALMAITAAYAYFNQKTWFRRALLFALSIPLAIAGNVARILTICLVAAYADSGFATGFYHDYSGYVVFAVAISLMVAAGEAISRIPRRASGAEDVETPFRGTGVAEAAGKTPAAAVVTVIAAVLTVSVMFVQTLTPQVTVCEPPHIEFGEIAGFRSGEVPPSEAELSVLPGDTKFVKRRYENAAGDWYLVSAVIGGKSKMSIHRPELCLPTQGFLMTGSRTVEASGLEWRFITLERAGMESLGFCYTFFNQDGFRTPSHVKRILRDIWDRSVHNRIDRWVMITVNSSRTDDAGMIDFIAKIKEALP